MVSRVKGSEEAFTLVELLIVIVIIAVLASVAIPQYLSYQRKARVTSYAQPLARACLIDIVSFCITNQGSSINLTSLKNCSNTTIPSPSGNVTLQIGVSGNCTASGNPPNGYVNATLDGVNDYIVMCRFEGNESERSIKCSVRGR